MNRLQSSIIFIISLIFLSSCSSLKDLANIRKPEVSIKDYQISDLSLRDVEITFDLNIENPNPVGITLDSYSYQLDIEEHAFLDGTNKNRTEINAQSNKVVQLPVRFTFSELFESVKSVVNQDEVNYTIGADLNLNIPVLGALNIPVEKKGTLPVLKLPSLNVADLKVKNISFTSAQLELNVTVDNPNSFMMKLEDVGYKLDINGLKSFSGVIPKSLTLPKNETESVTIPIEVNLAQLGMSAYQALVNKQAFEYSFSGSATVDSDLPIFSSSAFNFDKTGLVDILR